MPQINEMSWGYTFYLVLLILTMFHIKNSYFSFLQFHDNNVFSCKFVFSL